MWLISRWLPHRRKQANHAMAATAAALIAIAGLFLCGDPRAVVDTIQTAAFYMGLSHVYSHSNLVQQMPLPLSEQLRLTLLNNVWMLGPLGLGAFLQLAISRPRGFIEKILPLAAPWIGWCLVMHNHTARHHFEFLIAAPAVALALAWLVTKSEMAQKKTATLQAAVFILLAALQPMILPHPHISDGYDPTRLVEFGRSIKALTPPGSIVMAPLVSSVPLYYSDRHIVRGIDSPQAAIEALPELHRTYPNSPVYLAIPPFLREGFKMEGAQPAGATAEAILFKIE
jgi:hypothetical protein